MTRGARRGLLFVVAVLAAASQGAEAFNYHWGGSRAVTATITTNTNAYVKITELADCDSIGHVTGGTCTLRLTNQGTAPVRFWVNETSDPCIPPASATPSGNSGGALVAIGSSWDFTADIDPSGSLKTCNVFWNIQATDPNHLYDAHVNNYKMVIFYRAL